MSSPDTSGSRSRILMARDCSTVPRIGIPPICEQAAEKLIRAVLTSEGIQGGVRHVLPDMVARIPDENPVKPVPTRTRRHTDIPRRVDASRRLQHQPKLTRTSSRSTTRSSRSRHASRLTCQSLMGRRASQIRSVNAREEHHIACTVQRAWRADLGRLTHSATYRVSPVTGQSARQWRRRL